MQDIFAKYKDLPEFYKNLADKALSKKLYVAFACIIDYRLYWVPIEYLNILRRELNQLGKWRTYYRGPRPQRWRTVTLKKDAVAFTIQYQGGR